MERRRRASSPRIAGILSLLLGLVLVGAGLAHTVAVTSVAFHERGGYDMRLGTLLLVGLAVVSFGALMSIGGVGLWRGRSGSAFLSLFGAAGIFLASLALVPVIRDFATGLWLFGSYLAVFPFLVRRRSGERPGLRTHGDP